MKLTHKKNVILCWNPVKMRWPNHAETVGETQNAARVSISAPNKLKKENISKPDKNKKFRF
jgi:hypothetical protein